VRFDGDKAVIRSDPWYKRVSTPVCRVLSLSVSQGATYNTIAGYLTKISWFTNLTLGVIAEPETTDNYIC